MAITGGGNLELEVGGAPRNKIITINAEGRKPLLLSFSAGGGGGRTRQLFCLLETRLDDPRGGGAPSLPG